MGAIPAFSLWRLQLWRTKPPIDLKGGVNLAQLAFEQVALRTNIDPFHLRFDASFLSVQLIVKCERV
jgi:hypothetical protein